MKFLLEYLETNYDETFKTTELFETEEELIQKIQKLKNDYKNFLYNCYHLKKFDSLEVKKMQLRSDIRLLQVELEKLG